MLNKNLFKRFFLPAFVVFFCFILAMPTPCFASGHREVPNYSEKESYDGSWCEEEEEDWLEEIYKELSPRDDDSDPSGGGNGDKDLKNYNSAGLDAAGTTSLIPQNVCGEEEEYLPGVCETSIPKDFKEEEDGEKEVYGYGGYVPIGQIPRFINA